MKSLAVLIVAIASIVALLTLAQTPQQLRIVGTVAKLDGDRLWSAPM